MVPAAFPYKGAGAILISYCKCNGKPRKKKYICIKFNDFTKKARRISFLLGFQRNVTTVTFDSLKCARVLVLCTHSLILLAKK